MYYRRAGERMREREDRWGGSLIFVRCYEVMTVSVLFSLVRDALSCPLSLIVSGKGGEGGVLCW